MTKDLTRDPNRENPNLTPGLSDADRELLAMIAGNTQALPDLLDRLAGFSVLAEKLSQPALALVLNRFPVRPYEELSTAPLTSDPQGYQRIVARRDLVLIGKLTITSGQDGEPLVLPPSMLIPGQFPTGVILLDDPTRTETVTLQASFDNGANYWNIATQSFTGAFNSAGAVVTVSVACLLGQSIRMRATAAPVGGKRTFTVYGVIG